ncbi:hypothetical protein KBY93_05835 [Synechococcus sp. J7-Johnson]|uniref:hypothetical protein n=1 Tax=Synechococcus sp. J7-Johnson TaxID=2823737 RepID=UPI0020CF2A3A|nr:hypothetical protein [Synechococcus sp. J7-Johnson]MCP9840156.1 hypothetical protein [Synechococcus sp. J7-Johnson]
MVALTGWRSLPASRAMASGSPHGGCAALDPAAGRCVGSAFFSTTAVITTSSRPVIQVALAHSLAVVVCCCGLCFSAGFWLGTVLQQWVQPAQARKAKDPQRAANQEAWEAEVASGRWSEPKPVVGRFIGSHWDVEWLDEESEADPQQELPLRWAV